MRCRNCSDKKKLPEVYDSLTKLLFLFVQVNFHTSKSFCDRRPLKFGQMNILTHENGKLYGGVISCILACDSVCSTRR